MKVKKVETKVVLSLFVLAGLIGALSLAIAGDLEPSAPPAPTMHTLDEIHSKLEAIAPTSGDTLPTHEQISGKAAIHMAVVGSNLDPIEGSCEVIGREGTILVEAFDHSLTIPIDPLSGQPTGPRVHSPFRIVKSIDKATPKLYQALCTGENLAQVMLKFYRTGGPAEEEHYYMIELENAKIVDIKQNYPNLESISLAYRTITWTWESDGSTYTDNWITTP